MPIIKKKERRKKINLQALFRKADHWLFDDSNKIIVFVYGNAGKRYEEGKEKWQLSDQDIELCAWIAGMEGIVKK